MQQNNIFNPFIRTKDTTAKVMLDVIIALVPAIVMAYMAFGLHALSLLAVSAGSALVAEYVFSLVFLGRSDTLCDLSAIVTGLLLAFTLGAFTPLHVVAFGAAAAVVLGKLMFGGMGCNHFNPALVGREMMTVFFPSVMTSGFIWYNADAVNHASLTLTGGFADALLFNPSGAVGEYSIAALFVGGLYLVMRNRISWHIPFSLFFVFTAGLLVARAFSPDATVSFSLGGLMLGAVFMATDMPSSASTAAGKCYYGGMIGATALLFILLGQKYEYMSFSILLLNGFSGVINSLFRPRSWGEERGLSCRLPRMILLTVAILAAMLAVALIAGAGQIQYVIYAYVLYAVYSFYRRRGAFRVR